MATYPPPNFTEPLTIWNPANWEPAPSNGTTIDVAFLDANYVKYPIAQGALTFEDIQTNGNNNFFANITTNNELYPTITTISQGQYYMNVSSNSTNGDGAVIKLTNTNTTATASLGCSLTGGLNINRGVSVGCNTTSSGNTILLQADPTTSNQLDVAGSIFSTGNITLGSGTTTTAYLEFGDGSQQTTAFLGGGGGGDVFLNGGTALSPQTFTGYNQFDNDLDLSSNLVFPNSSSFIVLNNTLGIQNSTATSYPLQLRNASNVEWYLEPTTNPTNFHLSFGGMSLYLDATFVNLNATSAVQISNILTSPNGPTINATSLAPSTGTFYPSGGLPYFAYNNAGVFSYSPLVVSSTLSNYALLTTGTNNFTNTNTFTITPTTSATQTYPQSTNTTDLASIGYVNSAVAGGANTTYTQVFTGNFNSGSTITIPTGCVGFTLTVIGTGGTPSGYQVGVPDGTHLDYYYQIPPTAGGAQVSISNARIAIPKQGTYLTSTLQVYTNVAGVNGGTVSRVVLNGNSLAEALNGNPPVSTTQGGSATTGTPYSNPNYTSFTTFQGGAGQGNNESYTTMNVGQLGGGNIGGGIAGNGQAGSSQNQYGAGGLWGSLSGNSYGMPVFPPSPITYGGCIITWFL